MNKGSVAFGNVKPNHVLLNEYLPGQGISPHLDGDLFYPTIATVSLGNYKINSSLVP
jgi:alkylated DNA repair protein alkB family protein 6